MALLLTLAVGGCQTVPQQPSPAASPRCETPSSPPVECRAATCAELAAYASSLQAQLREESALRFDDVDAGTVLGLLYLWPIIPLFLAGEMRASYARGEGTRTRLAVVEQVMREKNCAGTALPPVRPLKE